MPTRTRAQLIAAVEDVIRPGQPGSPKITAADVRTAFEVIIDEVVARSGEQASTSLLEFVFSSGFGNEVSAGVGNRQAGTYRLATTQNTADVTFSVNGNLTSAPISVQSGDELVVTITRQNAANGAVITLESIGSDTSN